MAHIRSLQADSDLDSIWYYIASESELRAQLYARLPALRREATGLVAALV